MTGGAGIVSSHLCVAPAPCGYRLISLDNYLTGSKENHDSGVEYREGHTKDIEKHIPESPEYIFHLGEYARVHASLDEPELVWDMNIAGSLATFDFWC